MVAGIKVCSLAIFSHGTAADDSLVGGLGFDVLFGRAGDDVLIV